MQEETCCRFKNKVSQYDDSTYNYCRGNQHTITVEKEEDYCMETLYSVRLLLDDLQSYASPSPLLFPCTDIIWLQRLCFLCV